jgi:hypothetical protein
MKSTDGNSEDTADKAFAELFELFSKPTKSPQKAYRTYQLTFENGEPVFRLSEADRILDFEEVFAQRGGRTRPLQSHLKLRSCRVASRSQRRVAATSAVYRPCL